MIALVSLRDMRTSSAATADGVSCRSLLLRLLGLLYRPKCADLCCCACRWVCMNGGVICCISTSGCMYCVCATAAAAATATAVAAAAVLRDMGTALLWFVRTGIRCACGCCCKARLLLAVKEAVPLLLAVSLAEL